MANLADRGAARAVDLDTGGAVGAREPLVGDVAFAGAKEVAHLTCSAAAAAATAAIGAAGAVGAVRSAGGAAGPSVADLSRWAGAGTYGPVCAGAATADDGNAAFGEALTRARVAHQAHEAGLGAAAGSHETSIGHAAPHGGAGRNAVARALARNGADSAGAAFAAAAPTPIGPTDAIDAIGHAVSAAYAVGITDLPGPAVTAGSSAAVGAAAATGALWAAIADPYHALCAACQSATAPRITEAIDAAGSSRGCAALGRAVVGEAREPICEAASALRIEACRVGEAARSARCVGAAGGETAIDELDVAHRRRDLFCRAGRGRVFIGVAVAIHVSIPIAIRVAVAVAVAVDVAVHVPVGRARAFAAVAEAGTAGASVGDAFRGAFSVVAGFVARVVARHEHETGKDDRADLPHFGSSLC